MRFKTKQTSGGRFDVCVDGVKVAEIHQRRDHVKAKQTDRIRTKQVWLHDVTWESAGLKQLFGSEATVGRDGAFRNMYSLRGKTGTADVKRALEGWTPVPADEEDLHRETFPDQYTHPLVGTRVRVNDVEGEVTRVITSRFGQLAIIDGDAKTAYPVDQCETVAPTPEQMECVFDWDYVEREGGDVRFDKGDRSMWLRCRADGGWDAEGVFIPAVAKWLLAHGFTKTAKGCYTTARN